MPWMRLSDDWTSHPKVLMAGPLGQLVWLRILTHCARHLTDGHFTIDAVEPACADLVALACDPSRESPPTPMALADAMVKRLLECGLIDRGRGKGWYRIHDYDQYNPTKAAVTAEREAARVRMANVRLTRNRSPRSGDVRQNIAGSSPYPVPVPVTTTTLGGVVELGQTAKQPPPKEQSKEQRPPTASPPTYVQNCPPCATALRLLNDLTGSTYNAPGRSGEWMHRAHETHGIDRVVEAVRRQAAKLDGKPEMRRWMSPSVLFKPENWDTTVNDQPTQTPEERKAAKEKAEVRRFLQQEGVIP